MHTMNYEEKNRFIPPSSNSGDADEGDGPMDQFPAIHSSLGSSEVAQSSDHKDDMVAEKNGMKYLYVSSEEEEEKIGTPLGDGSSSFLSSSKSQRSRPRLSIKQPDDGLRALTAIRCPESVDGPREDEPDDALEPLSSMILNSVQEQQQEPNVQYGFIEAEVAQVNQNSQAQTNNNDEENVIEGVLARDAAEQQRQQILNNAVTAENVQADKTAKTKRRKRRHTVLVVILVVAVAAIGVAVGVRLWGKNDSDDPVDTLSPTITPTASPSMTPTGSPTTVAFYEVAQLVESAFGLILEDSNSPQYRAAEWIAHVDNAFGDFSGINTQRFMQRYALVVFYYATGGDISWTHQANFLSPDLHECDWNIEAPPDIFSSFGVLGVSECTEQQQVSLIELADNSLTGTLPDEISALSALNFLFLNLNNIAGSIPPSLFDIPSLLALWMAFNDFSGSIPTEIGNANNLVILWLQGTSLSGTIPSEIGKLSNLRAFTVADSPLITGQVPESIRDFSLEVINLGGNSLSGEFFPPNIPPTWANVGTFNLRRNQFSGILPTDVGVLSRMTGFSMGFNNFSGPIPESVTDLESIQVLEFSGNNFRGQLPQDWNGLSGTLRTLVFEQNTLTGMLPPSLGSLTSLASLGGNSNLFTGPIPSALSNLASNLEQLTLQTNRLTGTVPEFFLNFTSLEILNLSDNDLVGNMTFLCDDMNNVLLPTLLQLEADCIDDIFCPCCFLCCNDERCVNQ